MSGQTKPGSDHEPVDAEFKPVDSEPQPRKTWPRILAIARITGFVVAAALIGEELTGQGVLGQLALMLRWLLG